MVPGEETSCSGKCGGQSTGKLLSYHSSVFRDILAGNTRAPASQKAAHSVGREPEWNESHSGTDSTDGLLLSSGGIQA